jgi:hypothetical protein
MLRKIPIESWSTLLIILYFKQISLTELSLEVIF